MEIRSDPHSFWSVESGSAFGMPIRIQGYKIKGKAEFNQQIFKGFFGRKLYFSRLKLKKKLISKVKVQI